MRLSDREYKEMYIRSNTYLRELKAERDLVKG